MGKCTSCGTGEWHLGVCRCCELVDGEKKTRLVRLCSICKVDLCTECFKVKSIPKRIKAFGKQFFE